MNSPSKQTNRPEARGSANVSRAGDRKMADSARDDSVRSVRANPPANEPVLSRSNSVCSEEALVKKVKKEAKKKPKKVNVEGSSGSGRGKKEDNSAAEKEVLEQQVRGLQRQVGELQTQLAETQRTSEQRQTRIVSLEKELSEAGKRHADLMKNNSKRLMQNAALVRDIESERNQKQLMLDDLYGQSKVNQQMIAFRGECREPSCRVQYRPHVPQRPARVRVGAVRPD